MTGPATRSTTRKTSGRRRATALTLGAAAVALWAGCSVEKNYKLLSFFFDGVPPPPGEVPAGTPAAGPGQRPAPAAPGKILSVHPPYASKQCWECHGKSSGFVAPSGFDRIGSSVCRKCHAAVLDQYPLMHGPVAAQACLWCHDPHESTRPTLLKLDSPQLCLQCHRFQLSEGPQSPAHQDLSRSCLECHDGHGGAHRYFLRPPDEAR